MSSMLKLSEASSLGMHAMTYLAGRPDELVSIGTLAEVLHGSAHHLSKVMQRLVKAGLLTSVRGPRGGFRLARPAASVSLLDVYEAVEGKFRMSDCLLAKKICSGGRCICGDLLRETNRKVYEYLQGTKLLELVDVM